MLSKKIIWVYIFFISTAGAGAGVAIPKYLTVKNVGLLESKIDLWLQKTGEQKLLRMGQLKKQPMEVQLAKLLYPYLLPEKFVGIHQNMICSPILTLYRETTERNRYNDWKECMLMQNKGDPTGLMKKAIEDLKP